MKHLIITIALAAASIQANAELKNPKDLNLSIQEWKQINDTTSLNGYYKMIGENKIAYYNQNKQLTTIQVPDAQEFLMGASLGLLVGVLLIVAIIRKFKETNN